MLIHDEAGECCVLALLDLGAAFDNIDNSNLNEALVKVQEGRSLPSCSAFIILWVNVCYFTFAIPDQ